MKAIFLGFALSATLHSWRVVPALASDLAANSSDMDIGDAHAATKASFQEDDALLMTATGVTDDPKGEKRLSLFANADAPCATSDYSAATASGCGLESADDSIGSLDETEPLQKPSDSGAAPGGSRRYSGASTKQGFLGSLQRFFRRRPPSKQWDRVLTLPHDVDGLLEELTRAARKVHEVREVHAMSGTTPEVVTPLCEAIRAGDDALAALAGGTLLTTYEESVAQPSATSISFQPISVELWSLSLNEHHTVELERLVSLKPLLYRVKLRGRTYLLKAIRVDSNLSELTADVAQEVWRAHSYRLATMACGTTRGAELAELYGLTILAEMYLYGQNQKTVLLPGNFEVANFFVLLSIPRGTLETFAQDAARLEYCEPVLTYAARVAVSLQILDLMSFYARSRWYFTNISLSSFQFDRGGRVYLSAVSPWYKTGTAYEAVNTESGLYSTFKKKKQKEEKVVVLFDEHSNVPHIIDILVSVWCYGEEQRRAEAAAHVDVSVAGAGYLLSRIRRNASCIPHPLRAILTQLLGSEDGSRLSLANIKQSALWRQTEMLRQNAALTEDVSRFM